MTSSDSLTSVTHESVRKVMKIINTPRANLVNVS